MIAPEPENVTDEAKAFRLELYLAGSSSKARLTETNLRRLLDRELQDDYALEAVDILTHPDRADQANVLLTPALIRTSPGPAARLVGALDQREQILWLIGRGQKPSPSSPPAPAERIDNQGQALIDLCPDGVALVDDQGRMITANAAAISLLGLEGQSLEGQRLGLPLSSGMTVDLTKACSAPIGVSVAERRWNGKLAFLITLRDPGRLPAQGGPASAPSPGEGEAGPTVAELLQANAALTRTIQDSVKVTEELHAVRDELERSNGELQSFAYHAAHDIKAPLRTIANFAEFVLEEEGERISEESKALLTRMTASVRRLHALLDSLLSFAKLGAKQDDFTEVDLKAVLKWVTADLEPMIKSAFGAVEVGPLPKVTGNAGELYQLFMNLIGNAIKYRRPDVPPIVRVAAEPVSVVAADGRPTVRIVVEDNGVGFADSDADKVFEPFTRLPGNKNVEGSGIGLATVRKIVTRHGGRISASSRVGEGSRFVVELRPSPRPVPEGR